MSLSCKSLIVRIDALSFVDVTTSYFLEIAQSILCLPLYHTTEETLESEKISHDTLIFLPNAGISILLSFTVITGNATIYDKNGKQNL